MRVVRGNVLTIGPAGAPERDGIFAALQRADIHPNLGLKAPPSRAQFDTDVLELHRGEEMRREPVRYHALSRNDDGRFVGFFLDFGWDHPNDSIRELDLVFPHEADRNVGAYFDATIIISQYLFENALAKRVRWRVRSHGDRVPQRHERHGARLVAKQVERHPVSGEWMNTYIFEFAIADYQRLLARMGENGAADDYAKSRSSIWDVLRNRSG